MCDCGKPSADAAVSGHQAHAPHAHAPAETGTKDLSADVTADTAADAACTCAPSAQGHQTTHAGAATHA